MALLSVERDAVSTMLITAVFGPPWLWRNRSVTRRTAPMPVTDFQVAA
jgi:hypothetical protein